MANAVATKDAEVRWLLRIGTGIICLLAVVGIGGGVSLSGTLSSILTDVGWVKKTQVEIKDDVEGIEDDVDSIETEQKSIGTRLQTIETKLEP